MFKAKSWSSKKNPVLHPFNNKRYGITVYGAIGQCMRQPVFKLGVSTNKLEFQQFLREVKAQIKPQYEHPKPIMVYDAHRAHTAYTTQDLMRTLFEPL